MDQRHLIRSSSITGSPSVTTILGIAGLLAAIAAPALAQCEPAWQQPTTGPRGQIIASTEWDPDGAGPLGPIMVFSGYPFVSTPNLGRRINAWDGGSVWTSMDANIVGGDVFAFATDNSGALLAAGDFTVNYNGEDTGALVARWDGAAWIPLPGTNLRAALAILPRANGDIIIGGDFNVSAPADPFVVVASNIARWDGETWHSMGGESPFDLPIFALAETSDGRVIAGGEFTSIGGVAAANIAAWDGTAWSPLGTGIPGNSWVGSLAIGPDNAIIAAGSFNAVNFVPTQTVARWDGTNWTWLTDAPTNKPVLDLALLPDGSLLAAGGFTTIDGVPAARIARYDGTAWSPVGTGIAGNPASHALNTLAVRNNGSIVAAGILSTINAPDVRAFASPCQCPADLDNDGDFTNNGARDNAVDINDLLYFLVGFELGDVAVDLDSDGDPIAGTPDDAVDINDLLFFLTRFEGGC